MCGISGIVRFAGQSLDDDRAVAAMCDAVAHRGPDGSGVTRIGRAVLGHRRLKVIDLSERARQPMSNERRDVWVVFNGEIYNHKDLRRQLVSRHEFASDADTEVLVHGYEEWGMDGLVQRLRGMFAFALWDAQAETLWLVRDRLGVKPLVYRHDGDTVWFSSEPVSLYRLINPTTETLDRSSLDCYLTFGHMPADRTPVNGLSKAGPGTFTKITASGAETTRYWNVPDPSDVHVSTEEIEARLIESVGLRLEADVPLGFFLSGGIDSGLVLAMASKEHREEMLALTVSFGDRDGDEEVRLASIVATREHARHVRVVGADSELERMPQLVEFGGEPLADPSLLPSASICRAAKDRVTVALTGDGGDDIFCGYKRVVSAYLGESARSWVGRSGLEWMARAGAGSSHALVRRMATVSKYGLSELGSLYVEGGAVFTESERRALYSSDWAPADSPLPAVQAVERSAERYRGMSKADGYLRLDLEWRLPGRYLAKIDIASNAVGLECRSPFLDHKLTELAMSVPASQKMPRGRQKGLLRDIARAHLPSEVAAAPKRGFAKAGGALGRDATPLIDVLQHSEVGSDSGPLRQSEIDRLIADHRLGARDRSEQLWTLWCLELWWRRFVSRSATADLATQIAEATH